MDASRTDSTTIVTASDRLARHLRDTAGDAALSAGQTAWEQPDILRADAFWRRLFDELLEEDVLEGRLLGALPMAAWWEGEIARTFQSRPLLQVPGAARTAVDAWKLARQWDVDVARLENDFLDEARHLHRWGSDFESYCAEHNRVPEYAVADRVLDALLNLHAAECAHRLPGRVQLTGFLELAPAERRRWNRLADLGVEVTSVALPASEGRARSLTCADARDEHRHIASWAARRLAENPRQRIGIVVPDLAGRRDELRRQLLETLAPDYLPGFVDRALPFNFSLGEPLAEQPLVRTALDWLAALANDAVEFPLASRLGRSPYLAPAGELPARLALEYPLRDRGFAEFGLREWAYLARRNECPALADAIETAREAYRDALHEGRQLPSAWARQAADWLAAARWCHADARALDSGEFQAREAFTGLLGRLSELDDVIGRTTFAVALGWLRRLAGETLFQPRAADAPVQVLGLFEATGMSFDALWVAGLDDHALPAAPHPNPFLPLSLQREHGMPQSSAKREQEFARQLFDGLLGAAADVVCSYPARDGDAERRASPLIESLPPAEPVAIMPGLADAWLGAAPVENIVDEMAPRFAPGESPGGMRVLEDQSACAFRAFAAHRLRASDWPTPLAGPDARLRGSVVHEVLDRLWRRWRTRAALARRHASGEFETDVRDTVNAVLDESIRKHRHRWRDSLAAIERQRLATVVTLWVERVELARPDFEVIEIEGTPADAPPAADYHDAVTPVQAGPLRLRGKLDRVDRLADGRELVIDYKTGKAPSPGQFFGARPKAPQLPAYVVARRQDGHATPAGIAVASLRTGSMELRGVMQSDDGDGNSTGINGMQPVQRTKLVNDWDEAVLSWETMVAQLGDAFVAGNAAVDPLPGACRFCHLATLCRIHSIDPAVDAGGEGDDG